VPRISAHGRPRPVMRQESRQIDWSADPSAAVLRKIRAAEGRHEIP